jgi:hypothetical protein
MEKIYDAHKEKYMNFPFEENTFKDKSWKTLKELETWVKAHYGDPLWDVTFITF